MRHTLTYPQVSSSSSRFLAAVVDVKLAMNEIKEVTDDWWPAADALLAATDAGSSPLSRSQRAPVNKATNNVMLSPNRRHVHSSYSLVNCYLSYACS